GMSATAGAGVTLADVLLAARQSRGLLAPETAKYLVLAAADQLLVSPRVLDERRCRILVDGGRVVVPASSPAVPVEAERSLRRILNDLLQASHGNAPALRALGDATPRGAIDTFIGELESGLIPVDRTAAARALARPGRESLRLRVGEARSELPSFRDALPSDPFADEAETMPRGVIPAHGRRMEAASEIDELLLRAVASTPPP